MRDTRTEVCLDFILENWARHHAIQKLQTVGSSPLFVGVSGIQGSGKTTLVSAIAEQLRGKPNDLETVVLSIDDLYLSRQAQIKLANEHPDNPLIQHRGQPSTHDIPLATSLFSSLRKGHPVRIPQYDKGANSGKGDRTDERGWPMVNVNAESVTQVVLFEGWCVGFKALQDDKLKQRWRDAVFHREEGSYHGRLGWNELEHIRLINQALTRYDEITMQLDALIHIDAEDTIFVYSWRLEQEQRLRHLKNSGMTDAEVKTFIDGYYPSYELYNDSLRAGLFAEKGKQLRLILGPQREVKEVLCL